VAKVRVDKFIQNDEACRRLLQKTNFSWVPLYADNIRYPIFTPDLIKVHRASMSSSALSSRFAYNFCKLTYGEWGNFHAGYIAATGERRLGGKYVYGKIEVLSTGALLQVWEKLTGERQHMCKFRCRAMRTSGLLEYGRGCYVPLVGP
jgi:hypothetical protein